MEFQEAKRPWQCPGCARVYEIPANILDPEICKFCETTSGKKPEKIKPLPINAGKNSPREPVDRPRLIAMSVGAIIFVFIGLQIYESVSPVPDTPVWTERETQELNDLYLSNLTSSHKDDSYTDQPVSQPDRPETERVTQRALPGETPAGSGFFWKNLSIKPTPGVGQYTDIIGEMTNRSGSSYSHATFTLSVYDKDGRLLDTTPIISSNVSDGSTRSFDTTLLSTDRSKIDSIKIQFENGI